jgi:hypothetical protein
MRLTRLALPLELSRVEVEVMKAFLSSILTVIAMGVLAIAYGVLSPRMAPADAYSSARPMFASERVGVVDDGTSLYNYPNNGMARYASTTAGARPVAYETYTPAPRRVTTTRRAVGTSSAQVERARGRDWKKTALVIGGTTATGAGLGAIFGGKKGALIGAAIGGGASTIYEARKR